MKQYRMDSVAIPDSLQRYVTPEDAHQYLTGQQDSAETARLWMLSRMGLDVEDNSAADARDAMIRRREHQEE